MAKPCKYTLADGTVLSYDEMRAYMLENYQILNLGANALQIGSPKEEVSRIGEAGQNKPEGGEGIRSSEQREVAAKESETPSKKEIKEDGFSVPTDAEMKTKREQLAKEYDDAIQSLKDSFGALLNQNLGFAYDPRQEAAKMYAFHRALVQAARAAIRLGINDVKVFAASLGKKRVDGFTQRAWEEAERAEAGEPMIINSTEDMLNATYQKVALSYDKQYKDADAARRPFIDRVIENFHKAFFEADYVARKMLKDVGAFQALIDKTLVFGTSARAKIQFDNYEKQIFGGLSSVEKILLNNIIQARTIVSIDERFDVKGQKRPLHPGDLTMEDQKIYLGQLEQNNPELSEKLNERADAYFEANRDLLTERYKEGRLSIDSYNSLVNNEYSPRVFLEYLLEDSASESEISRGEVTKSDVKALSEGSVNSLYHNAEWLLKSNVLSTNRAIFHNRANRSLYDFAKANPDNGLIEIQESVGYNKETGQPIYKDAPLGFNQIQFFNDGVKQSIIVPAEFYKSWQGAAPLMAPALANATRIATGGSLKRMFATGVNPVFALKNFPRDVSHTLFFTNVYSPVFPKAMAQMAYDLVKTFPDAIKMSVKDKNSRYYKYLTEGGGMDFLSVQGKPFYKKSLVSNSFEKGVDALTGALGYFNNVSEVWVRLAIREREISKGTAKIMREDGREPNAVEMDRIAKNATYASRSQMDFSRGGVYAKAIDNFIPYFNAALQGFAVSSRYIKDNPKAFAFKFAQAAGAVAALTLYNLRYPDDDDDIPEEEKARNYIFLLPYTVDKKDYKSRPYIRIPKTQSIQPWMTMVEAITQWSATGKKPKKAGMVALESALPLPNPQNVPLIDALNTYASNYDRFLNKTVYKDWETTPDELEYYESRTPHMWIDMAQAMGLSPERTKEAIGKLTTDPDNNIYYTLMAQGYDALFKEIPENKRKEFTEVLHDEMVKSLTPFQRSFMSYTNPNLKKKSIQEIEEVIVGKEKLQNDTVNIFVREYIKGEASELDARKKFNDWQRTLNEDSVNTSRLRNKFEYSIRFKDVDNVFFRMKGSRKPEAQAHIFFLDWVEADDQERKVLEFRATELGLAPKDKNSVFWKTFNGLKKNVD